MDIKPTELSVSQWDGVKVSINRGMRDDLVLKSTLNKMYPEFEFGLFSEEDLDDRLSNYAWVVMTAAHWRAKDAWNDHVGARHGLKEKDGALMYKDSYVCARPITVGKDARSKVIVQSEESYARARGTKAKDIKQGISKGDEVPVGQSLSETTTTKPPADPLSYRESDHDEGEHVYDDSVEPVAKKKGRPKET